MRKQIHKNMDRLLSISARIIKNTSLKFRRYHYNEIDWSDRLIALSGARGAGKTTLMLQYLKEINDKDNKAVYVTLDDIYFSQNKLVDLAEDFYTRGGKYLFLDEVHKYPNWSVEIKNIYDSYPDMKIVFSGSSVLEVYKGQGDLSRRVSLYDIHEMSFREFVDYEYDIKISSYSLTDIIENHTEICLDVIQKLKPLAVFDKYWEYGSYPYYKDSKTKYAERLRSVLNTVLENDIPAVLNIDYKHIIKLKKLLQTISNLVPFKPNITKLAEIIEIDRKTVYLYLELLERAGIISTLYGKSKGLSRLRKPEKIYMNNNNLLHALSDIAPNKGTLRETFFNNQLKAKHAVNYTDTGDFLIDNKYIFEVGGKNKDYKQIANLENSYLAIDDIETGFGNRIPLWLFGFLY